jgi:hypothetical protein
MAMGIKIGVIVWTIGEESAKEGLNILISGPAGLDWVLLGRLGAGSSPSLDEA